MPLDKGAWSLFGKIGINHWSNIMERYLRQISLTEIGEQGQNRLKNSSALLVGVGGLGSPIATYLVAAGIGARKSCVSGDGVVCWVVCGGRLIS